MSDLMTSSADAAPFEERGAARVDTRHLAHVRVRRFAPGDPVLALECDKRPTSDLRAASVWTSGGVVAAHPEDVAWLAALEMDSEDRVTLYAAAVDLVSFEIRPLYVGPSAVSPIPHDDLYHALKYETWPEIVDAASLKSLAEAATHIQESTEETDAYQGVFLVGAFSVTAEDGRYTSVRFEGAVDWQGSPRPNALLDSGFD